MKKVYNLIILILNIYVQGEDGAEASSAGQMETILGVVGLSQVNFIIYILFQFLLSVFLCWHNCESKVLRSSSK